MLAELRIRDLAIINQLSLSFGPGFNVLTGETGAGKSIIIDAVGLLLGDRASQEVVRAGADRTEVEGTFLLEPPAAGRVAALIAENGLEADRPDALILAREVRSNGRSVARINGRAVTTGLLSEVGQLLLDIHGQGEHLSLLREREHVGLLDRYAGLDERRAALAELARRVRQVRRDLGGLRQDERERARRIDLLAYQLDEIRAARLQPGEAEELETERRRLSNAEQLASLSTEALQALQASEGEQMAAIDALGIAEHALERLARIDPSVQALATQLAEAMELLNDLGREVERYRDQVEFNPRRLQQVEERLHLIQSLRRKYGDTTEDVLVYADRAALELETISHAEERIAELEVEESRLLDEAGRLGAELSALRRTAGERMARAIEIELADLQMERARFGVQITWQPDPSGAIVSQAGAIPVGQEAGRYALDANGLDQVAFLVSANPGEPLKPLAKVASGGETSRLMLALKTVLGRADETPTLIFDEIDMGIGGRVGGTVGRKLWGLTVAPAEGTQRHQVLCITHLPQLAAYGDTHFHVTKHVAGDRTLAQVTGLTGETRVIELARMLGSDSDASRANVAEIMADVDGAKQQITNGAGPQKDLSDQPARARRPK
jgi:DNA repair protein RecN (Recombination protein N)